MKTPRILTLFILSLLTRIAAAQEMPRELVAAFKADDALKLSAFITKDNINNCYTEGNWQYSLLSQAVRHNDRRCFDLLIEKGADVNKACEGYVPALMHAVKYGRLEMVKILIAKGADINYRYKGDYTPADGETPLTYAEKYNQSAVAEYLRSIKSK